jgi:hypothetical protein
MVLFRSVIGLPSRRRNAAFKLLDAAHPDRFIYRPSFGADILDTWTGKEYEIATGAQEAMKSQKYPQAQVIPYSWSP